MRFTIQVIAIKRFKMPYFAGVILRFTIPILLIGLSLNSFALVPIAQKGTNFQESSSCYLSTRGQKGRLLCEEDGSWSEADVFVSAIDKRDQDWLQDYAMQVNIPRVAAPGDLFFRTVQLQFDDEMIEVVIFPREYEAGAPAIQVNVVREVVKGVCRGIVTGVKRMQRSLLGRFGRGGGGVAKGGGAPTAGGAAGGATATGSTTARSSGATATGGSAAKSGSANFDEMTGVKQTTVIPPNAPVRNNPGYVAADKFLKDREAKEKLARRPKIVGGTDYEGKNPKKPK